MISKNKISFNIKGAMHNIIALFLLINIFFPSSPFSLLSNFDNLNSKSLFISSSEILDSTSIDSVFNFAQENLVNTIYLKVRDNGEAYYNSSLVVRNDSIQQGLDPLNYAIEKSDSLSMKLYAWIDIYKLWNKEQYPSSNNQNLDTLYENKVINHIYYECPECLESDYNGRSDYSIKLNKLQSFDWEGIYLSPLHPKTNDYLFLIIKELLKNYKLDGIYLDYMQYQNLFYGYNEYGIKEFQNLYGVNPIFLNKGIYTENNGFSKERINLLKTNWKEFRSSKITEFIDSISLYIKRDSLTADIAIAINESLFDSKNKWLQDWDKWIKEEKIDKIVIKSNIDNFTDFHYNTSIYDNAFTEQELNKFVFVFRMENNSIDIADKIWFLRSKGYKSIGLFYNDYYSMKEYSPVFNTMNFEIK